MGKVSSQKALVKHVAEWGPQVGHIVDLHTGAHQTVTYWLRDDVRALCIFNRDDTQVRSYSCAQMERCEDLEKASDVTVRRFFLGLSVEDLRRGVLVTMERVTHSIQIVHQGH